MTPLILSVIAIIVYVLLTFEPTDQIGKRIIKLLIMGLFKNHKKRAHSWCEI
ncbi:hypothetical protein IGA_05859 [Bacillus cereus HuA3-9]|uniref:Uncharacterized protein n=1 Tax=Bacillus cereus HuA3-9 TaxID=1053205 RepID=R8CHV4_BACCE|nr:hypothetical protein IGA_05859 [Bacillus cereus HuA3-9]